MNTATTITLSTDEMHTTAHILIQNLPHPAHWTPELISQHKLDDIPIGYLCLIYPQFEPVFVATLAHYRVSCQTLSALLNRVLSSTGYLNYAAVVLAVNKIRWYLADTMWRTQKIPSTETVIRLIDCFIEELSLN